MDGAPTALAEPVNMGHDDWWLHLYAVLSRARVAHRVLVYDLPPWDILERGPPAYVREVAQFNSSSRCDIELASTQSNGK
eukprot:2724576-Pyramimonas_sp.AAC.1